MKNVVLRPRSRRVLLAALVVSLPSALSAAVVSDITPPDKRRAVVESATKLAKPAAPVPLPSELPLPFGPPGFELSDAEERDAANAAAGKASVGPKLSSDREILEQIAAKVPPTGAMVLGGEPILTFGKKNVKIGTHFTVTLNGQDYDLELVNIDLTNFTLRLNREEITRPIKPAKSP